MSDYQSPRSRGDRLLSMKLPRERPISISCLALEHFYLSPAGKALTNTLTSGGLSKFFNAVGQGKKMKKFI